MKFKTWVHKSYKILSRRKKKLLLPLVRAIITKIGLITLTLNIFFLFTLQINSNKYDVLTSQVA